MNDECNKSDEKESYSPKSLPKRGIILKRKRTIKSNSKVFENNKFNPKRFISHKGMVS